MFGKGIDLLINWQRWPSLSEKEDYVWIEDGSAAVMPRIILEKQCND